MAVCSIRWEVLSSENEQAPFWPTFYISSAIDFFYRSSNFYTQSSSIHLRSFRNIFSPASNSYSSIMLQNHYRSQVNGVGKQCFLRQKLQDLTHWVIWTWANVWALIYPETFLGGFCYCEIKPTSFFSDENFLRSKIGSFFEVASPVVGLNIFSIGK